MEPSGAVEPRTYESIFVSSLGLIDRIVGVIARRNGLSEADAEEFGSWFKARMIQTGYAALQKHRGQASLATYLSVVLVNAFRDYRNSRWGRWRPSASARRLGPLAVRLETMVSRDGYPMREAIATLERMPGVNREEIRQITGQIVPHTRPREVELGAEGAAGAGGEGGFWLDEAESARQAAGAILTAKLGELSAEDQVILRMRYWSGFSVADVARALRLDQKSLYRRIETLLVRLRRSLADAGLDGESVRQLFAQVD